MVINGIILSAGYSKRFGKFKPLAKIDNKTFIEIIICNLNTFCKSVTVVGGHNYDLLEQHISKKYKKNVQIIYNKNYDKGMFSSIKKGITENKNSDWFLIHQVDQPGLPKEFYKEFVAKIDCRHNWVQPKYNGRKGHPILFNKIVADLILEEKIESNLRAVSSHNKVIKKIWDCIYPEIHQDIDTMEDYLKLTNDT